MNSVTNSTESARSATSAKPSDNRLPKTRYLDDVASLGHMSSILLNLLEDAFAWSRAVSNEDGILTFRFSERWIDELLFAANDTHERARSLALRSDLFIEEVGE